jgi:CDP-diacylglycerol--serine O-phosphatidyltransferase
MVLPVFVVVVLFFALLVSYPWEVLTVGTIGYLASLPFGWLSYRDYERRDAEAAAAAAAASTTAGSGDALDHAAPPPSSDDERPTSVH